MMSPTMSSPLVASPGPELAALGGRPGRPGVVQELQGLGLRSEGGSSNLDTERAGCSPRTNRRRQAGGHMERELVAACVS